MRNINIASFMSFDRLINFSDGPTLFLATAHARSKLPISVRRVLTGGQTHGSLSVDVKNNGNQTREVLWLETMPWFMNLYIHSLDVLIDGQKTGW